MPVANDGPGFMKKGQSAPSEAATSFISQQLIPIPNISFNGFIIYAQSLVPPPIPAWDGMFFSIVILTYGIVYIFF